MASLTTTINVNVDSKLKQEATDILNDLGLNMSTAINIFLNQVVKRKGIPFSIVQKKPSKELIEALIEAEEIRNNPNRKGYNNIEELMKALLDD